MKFIHPVQNFEWISQTFAEHVQRAKDKGWCAQPGRCASGIYYYGGIDFAVVTGVWVVAAQDGRVVAARHDIDGYGSHIRIEHQDGYMTIYGHLLDFAVKVGDMVKAGQRIGRSDNTGNSDGPHLHFEVRLNGSPIDPAPLFADAIDVGGVDENQTHDDVSEEIPDEPVSFPELHQARVTSEIGLNMRIAAGIDQQWVGWLPKGTIVDVLRERRIGKDVWLQIGYQQWMAMRYGGDMLAVWEV